MALEVEMFYLYPKENSKLHKTDQYELVIEEDVPVLRRGQKFTVALRFNRDFDSKNDIVRICFNFGPTPHPIKGTSGQVTVDPSKRNVIDNDKPAWFANVLEGKGTNFSLEIYSPPSIPVGLWAITIFTSLATSTDPPTTYNYEGDLYFICNPWNCHDLTYMPETRLLEEYVLNDTGKIWVGPLGTTKGREWVFGQFDTCTLPAIQLMLEKSGLAHASRGDPIRLTRTISKMANSNDDDGILVGRWDGDYEDGTAPSAWTGSVPILQEYLDNESPVSYGQCWVFSGVCTTICRALGIPSRVVSNLVSAHDANSTLTIDKYFNEHDEELAYDPNNPEGGEDSIWNYHVWSDVYMARPDLPIGYGGWQAIDATPQETSGGYYQCGPASLEAIKKGQVGFNYDVGFMVASVNADLMRWKIDHSNVLGFKRIYCNKYHVGRFILTKQPFMYDYNGDRDRQDITLQYKAEEGSKAERLSLLNAVRGTEAAKRFFDMPEEMEDVEFQLLDLDQIKIGESFSVVVKMTNKSSAPRHVKCQLSAATVYYNGVKANPISKDEGEFNLNPNSTEEIKLNVTADEYLNLLVEYSIMKIYAIASVTETNQTWADEDDFQVIKPNIDIKVPHTMVVQKPATIGLKFVNPLKRNLTNCKFHISGATLLRNQIIAHPDVRPGSIIRIETSIIPKYEGEQKLVATFSSRELLDITGTAKVVVVTEEE